MLLLCATLWLTLCNSSPCTATSLKALILPVLVPEFNSACFCQHPLALLCPSLPPDLPSSIDCDLTAIMHPPVGQLKLSYLPKWRGEKEKGANNDARFVLAIAFLLLN